MPVIKRYPNRKLYDTEARQYITLEGIADLIRQGSEVQVIDNANSEDITAVILTQVIFDQEKKRSSLLPWSFLAGLAHTRGDPLSIIQRSLASSVELFRQVDEEIRRRVAALVNRGDLSEDQGKSLLDKLLSLAAPGQDEPEGFEPLVRRIIEERNLPTRKDLEQLAAELDALGEKLSQLNQSR